MHMADCMHGGAVWHVIMIARQSAYRSTGTPGKPSRFADASAGLLLLVTDLGSRNPRLHSPQTWPSISRC